MFGIRLYSQRPGRRRRSRCSCGPVVRERRPEEAAADVEQAQQAGEAGGDRGDLRQLRGVQLIERQFVAQQLAGEHFLQQWRSHAENADTGRHVQAQHQPHQPNCGVFQATLTCTWRW
jgi:hypothetical protein